MSGWFATQLDVAIMFTRPTYVVSEQYLSNNYRGKAWNLAILSTLDYPYSWWKVSVFSLHYAHVLDTFNDAQEFNSLHVRL